MKRLASIVLGMLVVLGMLSLYRLYQDSSPTPSEAVNSYITRITSKSPQKIVSVNIVSSMPFNKESGEQVLLFQAYDCGLHIHIAGYATIKKNLFGWHVDQFQMTGKSPLPRDVMAGLDWSDGIPIVYGQVFLGDVVSVEAVFSDPNQGLIIGSADVARGHFVIFGTPYSELTTLKLLDGNGNVLKQLTGDELQNG
ncbi:MAG TPA: hypothetical protein DEQ80_08000 [Anaerolinea thermolimosa]|uniref:Uncharacterized protein n=1 Tax=Anaerolinea thermolimosa TaxID=229919 RepID=A0A3D1JJI6_9CHLR|nr:hypothetical protein [Anaerolinea thermolimosa]GAP08513.1 hypothetical protein ATHL_03418 [Anaerolinea thermolimosa]HCE17786.1 hypothetical protein [Anaerolinea thermolimosa]